MSNAARFSNLIRLLFGPLVITLDVRFSGIKSQKEVWSAEPPPVHRKLIVHYSSMQAGLSICGIQKGASRSMNIEALCAAPQETLAHSPSQMPLSCPVAPRSQRELHKDGGGGGGGGVARRARAVRAPKAKSRVTPRGTSLTCSSFMCHLRASVGGAHVRVAPRRSIPFFAP